MILLLALLGCDPTSETACAEAAARPQTLTLGTGELVFLPVADGDRVGLTYGSQGGVHVWAAMRVSGIVQGLSDSLADPDNPMVSYVLKDGDVEIAGFHDLPHHFTVKVDGTWEFLGDRLIFFENSLADYVDVPLTMKATVLDSCGTELSAENEVFIDLDL